VRVSLTGGTGCSTSASLFTESMPGSGQVSYTLPSGCSGNVTIRAELVEIDGVTPLVPAVATTLSATIL
jgi:hypothetical protein